MGQAPAAHRQFCWAPAQLLPLTLLFLASLLAPASLSAPLWPHSWHHFHPSGVWVHNWLSLATCLAANPMLLGQ